MKQKAKQRAIEKVKPDKRIGSVRGRTINLPSATEMDAIYKQQPTAKRQVISKAAWNSAMRVSRRISEHRANHGLYALMRKMSES